MNETEARAEQGWWERSSSLEKVGAVTVVALATVGVAAVLAPGLVFSSVGGALTSGGVWLLNRGLRGGRG